MLFPFRSLVISIFRRRCLDYRNYEATACAAAVRKLQSFVVRRLADQRYGGMRALAQSVPAVSIIILWRLRAGVAKPIVHVGRGFSLPRFFHRCFPNRSIG
jgi:hypothetical protein